MDIIEKRIRELGLTIPGPPAAAGNYLPYRLHDFVEVFGEAGKHARVAVSTSGLPLDTTVEIQVTVAVT